MLLRSIWESTTSLSMDYNYHREFIIWESTTSLSMDYNYHREFIIFRLRLFCFLQNRIMIFEVRDDRSRK